LPRSMRTPEYNHLHIFSLSVGPHTCFHSSISRLVPFTSMLRHNRLTTRGTRLNEHFIKIDHTEMDSNSRTKQTKQIAPPTGCLTCVANLNTKPHIHSRQIFGYRTARKAVRDDNTVPAERGTRKEKGLSSKGAAIERIRVHFFLMQIQKA
jgi:hypothetical protein